MIRAVRAFCIFVFVLALVPVAARQTQLARVQGRVVAADTGAAVRSAAVRLAGMTPGLGTVVASTDEDGRFELRDVAAGSYTIQISKAGFVTSSFGLTPGTSGQFTVSAGQQIDLRDMRLARAGVVTGRVMDQFGDPVTDIAVTAWRLEHLTPARRRVVSRKSFQTDDRGEFRIYGLQPGTYYVSASRSVMAVADPAGGAGPALTSTGLREAPTFYPGTSNAFEAMPIEVKAGEDAAGIQFQVLTNAYGAVSGVVTNSKGLPYDSAVVWLLPARADNVEFSTVQLTAPTDRQGQFRIVNVSPGDYRLEVLSRAFLENVGKTGSAGLGEVPLGEVASMPVSVVPGATQEVNVQAAPGFRVSGRVFVDGAPPSADEAPKLKVLAAPVSTAISGQALPLSAAVTRDGSFVVSSVMGNRTFGVTGSSATFYRS
jgi:hypothetical protein